MSPTVFLGLVTHQGTRFPEASGPDGLIRRLSGELDARGVSSRISVHDEDRYSESMVPLTQASVLASIDAELAVEKHWRVHVNPEAVGLRLQAEIAARRLYRRTRLAPPWRTATSATDPGGRMLRRLVNIELAHLDLMHKALDSGADWAMIVEDDARLEDPSGFATALVDFMTQSSADEQPAYVNVSRSFDSSTLGLKDHLSQVTAWSEGIEALASDRPLTNTVCAVLYRSTFLERLVPELDSIPVAPVLPIDWKLNAALLNMQNRGELGPGDCWFLEPAPVLQGSMHAQDV